MSTSALAKIRKRPPLRGGLFRLLYYSASQRAKRQLAQLRVNLNVTEPPTEFPGVLALKPITAEPGIT